MKRSAAASESPANHVVSHGDDLACRRALRRGAQKDREEHRLIEDERRQRELHARGRLERDRAAEGMPDEVKALAGALERAREARRSGRRSTSVARRPGEDFVRSRRWSGAMTR
jgi:hypothetical protein